MLRDKSASPNQDGTQFLELPAWMYYLFNVSLCPAAYLHMKKQNPSFPGTSLKDLKILLTPKFCETYGSLMMWSKPGQTIAAQGKGRKGQTTS